jgi:hypothetical protein
MLIGKRKDQHNERDAAIDHAFARAFDPATLEQAWSHLDDALSDDDARELARVANGGGHI